MEGLVLNQPAKSPSKTSAAHDDDTTLTMTPTPRSHKTDQSVRSGHATNRSTITTPRNVARTSAKSKSTRSSAKSEIRMVKPAQTHELETNVLTDLGKLSFSSMDRRRVSSLKQATPAEMGKMASQALKRKTASITTPTTGGGGGTATSRQTTIPTLVGSMAQIQCSELDELQYVPTSTLPSRPNTIYTQWMTPKEREKKVKKDREDAINQRGVLWSLHQSELNPNLSVVAANQSLLLSKTKSCPNFQNSPKKSAAAASRRVRSDMALADLEKRILVATREYGTHSGVRRSQICQGTSRKAYDNTPHAAVAPQTLSRDGDFTAPYASGLSVNCHQPLENCLIVRKSPSLLDPHQQLQDDKYNNSNNYVTFVNPTSINGQNNDNNNNNNGRCSTDKVIVENNFNGSSNKDIIISQPNSISTLKQIQPKHMTGVGADHKGPGSHTFSLIKEECSSASVAADSCIAAPGGASTRRISPLDSIITSEDMEQQSERESLVEPTDDMKNRNRGSQNDDGIVRGDYSKKVPSPNNEDGGEHCLAKHVSLKDNIQQCRDVGKLRAVEIDLASLTFSEEVVLDTARMLEIEEEKAEDVNTSLCSDLSEYDAEAYLGIHSQSLTETTEYTGPESHSHCARNDRFNSSTERISVEKNSKPGDPAYNDDVTKMSTANTSITSGTLHDDTIDTDDELSVAMNLNVFNHRCVSRDGMTPIHGVPNTSNSGLVNPAWEWLHTTDMRKILPDSLPKTIDASNTNDFASIHLNAKVTNTESNGLKLCSYSANSSVPTALRKHGVLPPLSSFGNLGLSDDSGFETKESQRNEGNEDAVIAQYGAKAKSDFPIPEGGEDAEFAESLQVGLPTRHGKRIVSTATELSMVNSDLGQPYDLDKYDVMKPYGKGDDVTDILVRYVLHQRPKDADDGASSINDLAVKLNWNRDGNNRLADSRDGRTTTCSPYLVDSSSIYDDVSTIDEGRSPMPCEGSGHFNVHWPSKELLQDCEYNDVYLFIYTCIIHVFTF